jgi:putative MATE family efflux protein
MIFKRIGLTRLWQDKDNSILKQLIWLAIPITATSFFTIAYNLINLIFVGKLGSAAVAAVGSASFFMNLSWGISSLLTVGAGIKVSHSIGEQNIQRTKNYIRSGLVTAVIIAVICSIILATSRDFLISLISLNNRSIEKEAALYLAIIGISVPFSFQNWFFTSVFNGYGDSRSPFRINATALVINIIMDAVLIFGVGLGIKGAAIATVMSQATATLLFYRKITKKEELSPFGANYHKKYLKNILKLGISPTIQRVSFTSIAIMMARIITEWGPTAISVQKVGVQIEAITYMTIAGILSALSTISGQAYGAKNYRKQWNAYKAGLIVATTIGVTTSAILLLFPSFLFSIFLRDSESVAMGSEYLSILGFSQLFMCLELMTTGAFFGWGRTNIPAISSISLTAMRIPLALTFIHFWRNELSSVWWSISISSISKGILLVSLFIILFKKFIKTQSAI